MLVYILEILVTNDIDTTGKTLIKNSTTSIRIFKMRYAGVRSYIQQVHICIHTI